ncbi:hypothetical protein ACWDUX_17850 [Streptomyces sp. NPDC003444]
MTGWLTRHPAALSEDDRVGLKGVLAHCPELDKAAGHVRDFGEILTGRLGVRLPARIDAVDASRLPGLTGFALHLRRGLGAVTAGLTLHWSSGSIEGAVNRVKKIKRQLYGRAGFHLPRKMILLQQPRDTLLPTSSSLVISSLLTWSDYVRQARSALLEPPWYRAIAVQGSRP